MMKPILLAGLCILVACQNVQTFKSYEAELSKLGFEKVDSIKLASGHLYRITNFESAYVSKRNVDIWLPDTYDHQLKHQVLIMHDGQMLYDSTTTWNHQEWQLDEHLTNLIETQKVLPTLVISTWNVTKDRHSDYFPQKPFDFLPDSTRSALIQYNLKNSHRLFQQLPNSDAYLKFLVEEVKPMVDTTLKVYTNKEYTTIGGSSMGGLVSFYALAEYPEVFGQAMCLSTHWPGALPYAANPFPQAFFEYLEPKLEHLNEHSFYFDFGTKTLDSLYPKYELAVNRLFQGHGFSSREFKNLKFNGANHSEHSWQQRLSIPLQFTLKSPKDEVIN